MFGLSKFLEFLKELIGVVASSIDSVMISLALRILSITEHSPPQQVHVQLFLLTKSLRAKGRFLFGFGSKRPSFGGLRESLLS